MAPPPRAAPARPPPPPHRTSRRRFVQACVAASAAALAGAGVEVLASSLAPPSGPARRVDYLGAAVASGPAPQALPLLPLGLAPGGALVGVAGPRGVPGGVLDWYRYCGHAGSAGLQAGAGPFDERLRYHLAADRAPALEALRAAGSPPDAGWYLDRLGQPAHPEHFAAPGHGAPVRWRSEGLGPADLVPAVVLKVAPGALRIAPPWEDVVREGFLVPTADGNVLLAFVAFCKHLCCVPGWHDHPNAPRFGAADKLYCSCHHSVYDPLDLRPDFFVLREA